MTFQSGDRVRVQENRRRETFNGTVVYHEAGFGLNWVYVRPDEYSTIVSRGSSAREYDLGYFGVILETSSVELIKE